MERLQNCASSSHLTVCFPILGKLYWIELRKRISFADEDLIAAAKEFSGNQMQIPPMYSAIKVGVSQGQLVPLSHS